MASELFDVLYKMVFNGMIQFLNIGTP